MRPLSDRDRDALALTRRRLRRVLEGLPSSTGLALEMTCVVPHWIRRLDAMVGPEAAASEDFDAALPEGDWTEGDCGCTLGPMAFHEVDLTVVDRTSSAGDAFQAMRRIMTDAKHPKADGATDEKETAHNPWEC